MNKFKVLKFSANISVMSAMYNKTTAAVDIISQLVSYVSLIPLHYTIFNSNKNANFFRGRQK